MDISIIISAISAITVICTIFGWFVIHHMSQKRDFLNRKKEVRISCLIDAFRRIEDASHREEHDKLLQLESAIADIQLFGTKKQVELSKEFVTAFAQARHADALPLLNDLRDDLRKELNLEPITDITWSCLRIRRTDSFM